MLYRIRRASLEESAECSTNLLVRVLRRGHWFAAADCVAAIEALGFPRF